MSRTSLKRFENRKQDHIRLALDSMSQVARGGLRRGLDDCTLIHEALPELDFVEIELKSRSLSQSFATPFYIAGMTAGHADAPALNRRLAEACERRGWMMGVGSQRRDLDFVDEPAMDRWAEIRRKHPDLCLLANIGASQIIDTPVSKIQRLVDLVTASALCVHLNALQEVLQPEGTPQFRGVMSTLQKLGTQLKVPLIVKETGCGFSESTLKRLSPLRLGAIDVSGLGGTHWGRIEGARAGSGSKQRAASVTFKDWGILTAQSVESLNRVNTTFSRSKTKPEVWASGGVRSGLDAAKLFALGATRVGFAQPALKAALKGAQPLERWMELQEFELKVAMFCTGSKNVQDLRGKAVWI